MECENMGENDIYSVVRQNGYISLSFNKKYVYELLSSLIIQYHGFHVRNLKI